MSEDNRVVLPFIHKEMERRVVHKVKLSRQDFDNLLNGLLKSHFRTVTKATTNFHLDSGNAFVELTMEE